MAKHLAMTAVVIAVVLAAVGAATASEDRLYVMTIDPPDETVYEEALQIVRETNGEAIHRFPPEAAILRILPSVAAELAVIPGLEIHDDAIADPGDLSPTMETALLAWNVFFHGRTERVVGSLVRGCSVLHRSRNRRDFS
ncbi:MAG: hypothetical protein M5R36_10695 [Deltaproteobacteria bacterium]|nr:hypothetical protein [Deltaproteobacteria bacterium]